MHILVIVIGTAIVIDTVVGGTQIPGNARVRVLVEAEAETETGVWIEAGAEVTLLVGTERNSEGRQGEMVIDLIGIFGHVHGKEMGGVEAGVRQGEVIVPGQIVESGADHAVLREGDTGMDRIRDTDVRAMEWVTKATTTEVAQEGITVTLEEEQEEEALHRCHHPKVPWGAGDEDAVTIPYLVPLSLYATYRRKSHQLIYKRPLVELEKLRMCTFPLITIPSSQRDSHSSSLDRRSRQEMRRRKCTDFRLKEGS